MGQSSNYYHQGNGFPESTNKTLIQILKKTIIENHKDWHKKLTYVLWERHITQKYSTGYSPYTLVYGKESRMLLHMELNVLVISISNENM